jgi:hypothetical protein
MAFKKLMTTVCILGLAVTAAFMINLQPAFAADKVIKMTLAHADVADPPCMCMRGRSLSKSMSKRNPTDKFR